MCIPVEEQVSKLLKFSHYWIVVNFGRSEPAPPCRASKGVSSSVCASMSPLPLGMTDAYFEGEWIFSSAATIAPRLWSSMPGRPE